MTLRINKLESPGSEVSATTTAEFVNGTMLAAGNSDIGVPKDASCSHDPNGSNAMQHNFATSLEFLIDRLEWVPIGWQIPYVDMLAKLHAVDCSRRAQVIIAGPYLSDWRIAFDIKGEDSIVAGIVRKAIQIAECTCHVCGAAGRPRELDSGNQILCASCFAPRVLSQELARIRLKLAEPAFLRENFEMPRSNFNQWLAELIPLDRWIKRSVLGVEQDIVRGDILLAMSDQFEHMHAHVNACLE